MKRIWQRETVLGSAKCIQNVLCDFNDLGVIADKARNLFTGGGGEYFALSLLPVNDHAVSACACVQCFGGTVRLNYLARQPAVYWTISYAQSSMLPLYQNELWDHPTCSYALNKVFVCLRGAKYCVPPLVGDTVFGPNHLKTQKHTKHTLFRVFEGRDSEVQHCVSNLVKEHSSSEKSHDQKHTLVDLSVL